MDDAEDVAQDVLISLMKTKINFTDKNHEKAWLYRATINRCLNIIKSPWRSKKIDLDEVCNTESGDKNPFIKELSYMLPEESDVMLMLYKLPQNQQIAIYLHYVDGYIPKEIAEIMCKKKRSIDSLLYRGLANLKIYLKGNDDNE